MRMRQLEFNMLQSMSLFTTCTAQINMQLQNQNTMIKNLQNSYMHQRAMNPFQPTVWIMQPSMVMVPPMGAQPSFSGSFQPYVVPPPSFMPVQPITFTTPPIPVQNRNVQQQNNSFNQTYQINWNSHSSSAISGRQEHNLDRRAHPVVNPSVIRMSVEKLNGGGVTSRNATSKVNACLVKGQMETLSELNETRHQFTHHKGLNMGSNCLNGNQSAETSMICGKNKSSTTSDTSLLDNGIQLDNQNSSLILTEETKLSHQNLESYEKKNDFKDTCTNNSNGEILVNIAVEKIAVVLF